MHDRIPVIDLFSGPGGLSEGFSRFGERDWTAELAAQLTPSNWRPPKNLKFKIALSIEKDPIARQTLRLRAFFRQFETGRAPAAYYELLRGEISEQQLFAKFPAEYAAAESEAWCTTLGEESVANLDERITHALDGADRWCLIGGPPCQAYSLAGRSRNKGIAGYRAADDHRHFLYREYLRIVAKHQPPAFVMENVKGILSSKVDGASIFDQILEDLRAPGLAVNSANRSLKYEVVPFVVPVGEVDADDNRRFILRAEELGVPQARHRVILFGIRSDMYSRLPSLPQLAARAPVPAADVLDELPKLRGGVSRVDAISDGERWLSSLGATATERWLKQLTACDRELADRIRQSARDARCPAAQRGGQFVRADAAVRYAKRWFLDSRIGGVCNHESRSHMPKDLQRYLFAACFAEVHDRSPDLADFPTELLPKHKNAKQAAKEGALFSDRFRVQLWSRPSTTVTSHISKDGHYYIHPDPLQCRALTVREAARLQTFPDNYFFCGPRTEQYHQVGNAVPPLLAVQLAGAVARVFE